MGFGGVLGQYAGDGADLGRALRTLVGTLLGFVLVVVFALWLMHRSRADRSGRLPVSGWYADPWSGHHQRWWNGDGWTGHVRPAPAQAWYGSTPSFDATGSGPGAVGAPAGMASEGSEPWGEPPGPTSGPRGPRHPTG